MKAVFGVAPGGVGGVLGSIRMRGVAAALLGTLWLVPAAAQVGPAGAAGQAPYGVIGARHLYDTYANRIFHGKLPPLLYAIAITETELDENGNVLDTIVVREPAVAKETLPWIVGLIRGASPFPKPVVAGTRLRQIWLVDRNYMFQLDALTEGQQ